MRFDFLCSSAVHFFEQCGAAVTSGIKVNRGRRVRGRTSGVGLVELVLRVRVGEPLFVSFLAAVVECQAAPVAAEERILLIAREEIRIRSKECIGLRRNIVGVRRRRAAGLQSGENDQTTEQRSCSHQSKDQRELLLRDDRDSDAIAIDVDADERSAIDDGVCCLGRRSTVLQHLLEASAVCLATEK